MISVSSPFARVLMYAVKSLKSSSAITSLSFLIAIALWAPSFAAKNALSKSSMTVLMVARGAGKTRISQLNGYISIKGFFLDNRIGQKSCTTFVLLIESPLNFNG